MMQREPILPKLQSVKTDVTAQLPEHRQRQVEAGLSTFQSVLAERDQAERKLNEAVVKIDSLNQQLSSMQGIVTMMESAYLSSKADLEGRVRDYQQQRDFAVAKVATLEAHLLDAYTLIKNAIEADHADPEHTK